MRSIYLFAFFLCSSYAFSQKEYQSKVWSPDNKNGTYSNPIIHADYSDPDVVRVGNDFYMVSSSFEDVPALPILHSKDLVNWKLVGHALEELIPSEHFSKPRHGEGVWAPSIRYHKNEFYIYYPVPDFGIYMVKAKNAEGPWSPPVLVEGGKGLIDPCPLWDDDGNAYLVHAFAGSRSGIKSILVIKKMNDEGTKTMDKGIIVYDGHETDPTIEGPKIYKHLGYYYIFAPAGGVTHGWQLVLRSKNIYGPYERKIVLEQGSTSINGPHQGAWVRTANGQDWFIHFQDKGAYGRIVHLQPMKWEKAWPVMGKDLDGNGIGEPVYSFEKPYVLKFHPLVNPRESDEFNNTDLGLQWQWMANPVKQTAFLNPSKGSLVLYSDQLPDGANNLWDASNVLLQKFPAEEFMVTARIKFMPNSKLKNEKAGLVIMGLGYASIGVKSMQGKKQLVFSFCENAGKGDKEKEEIILATTDSVLYLRVRVHKGADCSFGFSTDGINYRTAGRTFKAQPGKWKGAKIGLFCTREEVTNDSGYMEVDWFRVEPVE